VAVAGGRNAFFEKQREAAKDSLKGKGIDQGLW